MFLYNKRQIKYTRVLRGAHALVMRKSVRNFLCDFRCPVMFDVWRLTSDVTGAVVRGVFFRWFFSITSWFRSAQPEGRGWSPAAGVVELCSRYRFMSIFPVIYESYERKLGFARKCLSFSYICVMQIIMVDKNIIADNRATLYYHILLSAITGFFCGTVVAHTILECWILR